MFFRQFQSDTPLSRNEILGYAHNFCNKQVRQLTEKSGQYFSCIFHNGFRFDMTFLTKGIWLSFWQTQDVSLLGSGLTTLKSYDIGRHVKFIDSVKYYQQSLSKLARSTMSEGKKKELSVCFQNILAFNTLTIANSFYKNFLKIITIMFCNIFLRVRVVFLTKV